MEQGGTTANYNGNSLENFIEHKLNEIGYKFIDKKKFEPAIYLEQPIYSKQVYICRSIYDTTVYCDFILYHPKKHKECLIIESKWQQSKGSVDEKYPYLILNIQHKYPHKTLLVIDGGGYKENALKWLKKQVGNNLIGVMNMSDFQIWANKGKI